MPLYEYKCESCGVTFEVIQKYTDPAVGTCKTCGGTVRRLLSAPAIQFKGTGWYITDYARKGKTGADADKPSSTPASSDAADKKSDATEKKSDAAEKKSDAKSATPAPTGPSTPKS
jgi:putative FmdB family regulatory protein